MGSAVYRVLESAQAGQLEGGSPWMLPGVTCPTCGKSWFKAGVSYPTLSFEGVKLPPSMKKPGNVSLEEYRRTVSLVDKHCPGHGVLFPGTEFAPARVSGHGRRSSFLWLMGNRLFVASSVVEEMTRRGVRAVWGKARLVWGGKPADYVEYECTPQLRISNLVRTAPTCSECGRESVNAPDRLLLDMTTWPTDVDLVRGLEATPWLFATESFVDAAKALSLDGADFERLENSAQVDDEAPSSASATAIRKVSVLGLKRRDGYVYQVRDSGVWEGREGHRTFKKLASAVLPEAHEYIYFLDGDGDISRMRRAKK